MRPLTTTRVFHSCGFTGLEVREAARRALSAVRPRSVMSASVHIGPLCRVTSTLVTPSTWHTRSSATFMIPAIMVHMADVARMPMLTRPASSALSAVIIPISTTLSGDPAVTLQGSMTSSSAACTRSSRRFIPPPPALSPADVFSNWNRSAGCRCAPALWRTRRWRSASWRPRCRYRGCGHSCRRGCWQGPVW